MYNGASKTRKNERNEKPLSYALSSVALPFSFGGGITEVSLENRWKVSIFEHGCQELGIRLRFCHARLDAQNHQMFVVVSSCPCGGV